MTTKGGEAHFVPSRPSRAEPSRVESEQTKSAAPRAGPTNVPRAALRGRSNEPAGRWTQLQAERAGGHYDAPAGRAASA